MRDVMITAPYSVQENHPLAIAAKLMQDKHIRHLPVFDNRKLIGVLGEHDLLKAISKDDSQSSTVAAAVKSAAVVSRPEDPVEDVLQRMVAARADVSFVIDNERLVGVFTTIDALKVLAQVLAPEQQP